MSQKDFPAAAAFVQHLPSNCVNQKLYHSCGPEKEKRDSTRNREKRKIHEISTIFTVYTLHHPACNIQRTTTQQTHTVYTLHHKSKASHARHSYFLSNDSCDIYYRSIFQNTQSPSPESPSRRSQIRIGDGVGVGIGAQLRTVEKTARLANISIFLSIKDIVR